MSTRLPRNLYLLFGASLVAVVISLVAVEFFVPDVEPSDSLIPSFAKTQPVPEAGTTGGPDSLRVSPADGTTSGAGQPGWLVGSALGLAALGLLVAGASVWGGPTSTEAPPQIPETAVASARDVSDVLVETVVAGRRWGQLAHLSFQMGDDAPEDFPQRVAQAKATTASHREELTVALMRGAAFLPNDVLDAAHEVDRIVEQMLADDSVPARYGGDLATGLTVAYYTFAKTVRAWTSAEELDVERLLGGSPDDADAPTGASALDAPDLPDRDDEAGKR